ncbi:MAG TPA: hypothetical protein VF359_01535 [Anaerolineales bacterium]
MRNHIALFLSILVLLATACSLVTGTGTTPLAPASTSQGNGNQPVGTPPANPVSINDGLGSLNSYQMTVKFISTGPDPAQSSTTIIETQHSKDTNASYTHLNITVVDSAGSAPNNTDGNIYRIGNDQCSGSGEDWTWTSMPPNEAEMLDILTNMLSLTPLIDTPAFVAQETINGIPTNHFKFKVSGLGVTSGADVIANQGDYWLAIDGQFIVKYSLILETSLNPQTNVLHEEISIDVNQINQPVNIAFPQGCLDASLVTPTP